MSAHAPGAAPVSPARDTVAPIATFGVLVFPDAEELDFVGPWEMLTLWSRFAQGPANCIVVGQSLAPVVCAKGLSVNPHASFESCPPLDALLVPGGVGTDVQVDNTALVGFIAAQARRARALLSVCSGAFLLHRAGLLSGRRATTHWMRLDALRALGDVDVVEERYVRDGPVWTSAGVSAGIDLMLEFIAQEAGETTAGKVQFGAEYYPSGRSYGGFHAHPKAPRYARRITGSG